MNDQLLVWISEHYFLASILVYLAMEMTFKIFNRVLRSVNIAIRGWPTALNMDADGDIVHPENKDNV